ncbi:MAG: hypothetical protein ACOC0U_08535 [Desulfovibrionales bacterium]
MKSILYILLGGMLLMIFASESSLGSQPEDMTVELTVQVIARGSKLIGTSMGGMRIVIQDAETGEVLEEGVTSGETGDTEQIMKTPRTGADPVVYDDAAAFKTKLELSGPRMVRITAYGPLNARLSAHSISAEQWLIPGKDLTGKAALILEWPGLVVEILEPEDSLFLKKGESLEIEAGVVMGCGCVITPDGLWNVEDFEVLAVVTRQGEKVTELPLSYGGTPSSFTGVFHPEAAGEYGLTVHAFQRSTGNTGLDSTVIQK